MKTLRLIPAVIAGCLSVAATPMLAEQLHTESAPDTRLVRASSNPDALGFLLYYQTITNLGELELLREFEDVEKAVAHSSTGFNSLRLAILLSIPDTPVQNNHRAKQLIRDYLLQYEDIDEDSSAFARLLLRMIGENERQMEKIKNLGQALHRERKLRETLRNQVDRLDLELAECDSARTQSVGKANELEWKLIVEYEMRKKQKNRIDRLNSEITKCDREREQSVGEVKELEQKLITEHEFRKTLQEQLDQLKEIEKSISEKEQSVVAPIPEKNE